MFKVAGVILFMVAGTYLGRALIGRDFLAWVVAVWIPRLMGGAEGTALTRQIANAHTVFNVVMALVFLPFSHLFGRLVMKLLPDLKKPEEMFKPM